jgi:hypothetical protein
MPQILAGHTDDQGFIRLVNSLLFGVISSYKPDEIWSYRSRTGLITSGCAFQVLAKLSFAFQPS